MTESIDKPRIIPGKDRPGGRRRDHREHRGDYLPPSQVERLRTQGQITFGDLAQSVEQPVPAIQAQETTASAPEPPIFGSPMPKDKSKPEYKTLNIGERGYSAPPWDKTRSRVFEADRAVAIRVFQRVEDPRDKHKPKQQRRVSIEMELDARDEEGRPIRFWVNPTRGGFEGRKKTSNSRPTLKLKTQS